MTTTEQTKGALPTHRIYHVSGEGKQSKWTEIGAAWPNKDGNGFSITTIAGRFVMRTPTERSASNDTTA